jgi:uncharacterized phage-associated protein
MKAKKFAEYLINEGKKRELDLDQMQIMKLTYICHGFFLAKDLNVIDETPRTWLQGPVYPSIAFWLKDNKDALKSPTQCSQTTIDQIERGEGKSLVDKALNHFGSWTGAELSTWTHEPGSPWERELFRAAEIDTPLNLNEMKNYFKAMLK